MEGQPCWAHRGFFFSYGVVVGCKRVRYMFLPHLLPRIKSTNYTDQVMQASCCTALFLCFMKCSVWTESWQTLILPVNNIQIASLYLRTISDMVRTHLTWWSSSKLSWAPGKCDRGNIHKDRLWCWSVTVHSPAYSQCLVSAVGSQTLITSYFKTANSWLSLNNQVA